MGEMADMTFVEGDEIEDEPINDHFFYKCPKCGSLTFGRGGKCYECQKGLREG